MSHPIDPSQPPTTGGWRAQLAEWLSHDTHPLVQFVKYGIAGVLATGTHILCFSLCTETFLPVEAGSSFNFTLASIVGFIVSAMVAYLINIKWVFKPGRHHPVKELLLFYGAALIAFLVGTPLGQVMVNHYELYGPLKYLALGVTIVISVMVNYTCRKFFIFKG